MNSNNENKLSLTTFFQNKCFIESGISNRDEKLFWTISLGILRKEYLNNLFLLEDQISKRIITKFNSFFNYTLGEIKEALKEGARLIGLNEEIFEVSKLVIIPDSHPTFSDIENRFMSWKLIDAFDQVKTKDMIYIIRFLKPKLIWESLKEIFPTPYKEESYIDDLENFLNHLRHLRNLLAHQSIWSNLNKYFKQAYWDSELLEKQSKGDFLKELADKLILFYDGSFKMRIKHIFENDELLEKLIDEARNIDLNEIIRTIIENDNISSI